VTRKKRPISQALVRFHRTEQVARMKHMLAHGLHFADRPKG
jgi:hypothetical protein